TADGVDFQQALRLVGGAQSIAADFSPQACTSFSIRTIEVSAGVNKSAPHQSKRLLEVDSVCGNASHPRTAPASPQGTDTKKIDRHPNFCKSRPPITGPALMPTA